MATATILPAQAAPQRSADPFWAGKPSYTEQTLAMGGDGVFPNYRIPALTVTPGGDLLASYDGRPTSIDAPGPNSILQRRSTDLGRTWEPTTAIHAGKTSAPVEGFSDPSYVVDRQTGAIFNFHVHSFDAGLTASRPGVDPTDRRVLHADVSRSDDDGRTWQHRTITADITPDLSVKSRFAASGAGIQLRYGPHAGRLLQQFTIMLANGDFQAMTVYSDDHGATWQAGRPVGTRMDENKVVELSAGRIMLNSRDSARSGYRKVAYSTDGGVTYGEVTLETALPDPANNASIIRAVPDAPAGSAEAKVLLFSNAASSSDRAHGTVRASCDDGQTWPIAREFRAGEMAYSTLAMLPNGNVGMLYEPGHNGIVFATFNLAWLNGVCTSVVPAQKLSVERGDRASTTLTLTNQWGPVTKVSSLAAQAPDGWTVRLGRVGKILPHRAVTVPVDVSVPATAKGGRYEIPVVLTDDRGREARGTLVVTVPKRPDELASAFTVEGPTLLDPKTSYAVGDKLTFSFHVTSTAPEGTTATITPTGNLRNLDPAVDQRNCRWRGLQAGKDYTCSFPYHVITAEDMAAGSFTPEATWTSTSGEDVTTITTRGVPVKLR